MLSLQAAAGHGLGVTLLPDYMAGPDPALMRIPGPQETLRRELWLVVHADLKRSPPVRAVMDFLGETIGDAFPIAR